MKHADSMPTAWEFSHLIKCLILRKVKSFVIFRERVLNENCNQSLTFKRAVKLALSIKIGSMLVSRVTVCEFFRNHMTLKFIYYSRNNFFTQELNRKRPDFCLNSVSGRGADLRRDIEIGLEIIVCLELMNSKKVTLFRAS